MKKIMWHINRHLFPEKCNGKVYKSGGCKPLKVKHLNPWHRSYEMLGGIFGNKYKPRYTSIELDTIDIKDQNPYQTCSWNTITVARQVSEKVPLSVRSIVAYAKSKGLLSGDGLSTLVNNNKAVEDFGVAEESLVPEDKKGGDFQKYADPNILTVGVRENAYSHRTDKTKDFYVKTVAEYVKALEDGYAIALGFTWRTGYNINGGLTAPWKITWGKGYDAGGHATLMKGASKYVLDKDGFIVDALGKVQNSWGKYWADKGCYYVQISDLVKAGIAGLVTVDVTDQKFDEIVASYEGKQVKGKAGGIYLIQDGKKRPFPSSVVFFIYGGRYGKYGKTYVDIAQSTLDRIVEGNPIEVVDSPYWDEIATRGISPEFVKLNPEQVSIWQDNPETLKQIVETMKEMVNYEIPQPQKKSIFTKFLNIFK